MKDFQPDNTQRPRFCAIMIGAFAEDAEKFLLLLKDGQKTIGPNGVFTEKITTLQAAQQAAEQIQHYAVELAAALLSIKEGPTR